MSKFREKLERAKEKVGAFKEEIKENIEQTKESVKAHFRGEDPVEPEQAPIIVTPEQAYDQCNACHKELVDIMGGLNVENHEERMAARNRLHAIDDDLTVLLNNVEGVESDAVVDCVQAVKSYATRCAIETNPEPVHRTDDTGHQQPFAEVQENAQAKLNELQASLDVMTKPAR